MFQTFRLSMAWLHTWFGLVLGFVLMVVFFFGALSVFDREIDRWAVPESRFQPQPMPSFDAILKPAFERMQPAKESVALLEGKVDGAIPERFDTVRRWGAYTTHRDPVVAVFAGYSVPNAKDPEETVWAIHALDPRDGKVLPDGQLRIGSQFFYPLHYSLNLNWKNLGTWIVGFAALMMLAALVSGVVMHRKVFREFFTFRRDKSVQRSALDLHNLTGVVALPFHFFFAFTGLVIFAGIYFPVAHTQLHDLHELSEKIEARETGLPHDRAGVAAPMASVDAMVAEARRRWAAKGMAGDVGYLGIEHVGDANAYVSVYRAGTDRVALTGEGIHFKASSGELLREDPPRTAVDSVNEFLTGLHLQHFRHWLLRWLYVLGGLLGCVCIATGFIFFVEKRKKQHAKSGGQGSRIVDALAVTTVTGMLIATTAMLVANRLLPEALADKGEWEKAVFWSAWGLALLHAFVRNAAVAQGRLSPAWREQCVLAAMGAVAAVVANALTTGDHLLRTLSIGYWPVAGVDLSLLALAAITLHAARRLGQRMPSAAPTALNGTQASHG
ncbi:MULTISPECIES: PepSY domain-containing protein [unclassified Roseateles]|uniref:PepSY-associated TM helix domain-containing protein n=1 Tax=unclassified Roseateles TaxID=2626991 RepID=UPI0006F1E45D|nr:MULTISPECIES: PepSY-associated TM helix domain-containing protein [unclassified Roseateles]KQW43237.1 peptidase [Pelomonas sp. Root405]KRA70975.1 peptidase [Pelomonas sp. Root662]